MSGDLLRNVGITLARVAAASVIAFMIGTAIGIFLGRHRDGEPLLRWLADLLPQCAGAHHHRALLFVDRPQRGGGDHRGRAEQDPQCGGDASGRSAGRRPALRRDGAGLPLRSTEDPAACRSAAARALSGCSRALRPGADLEDRAGGRADRPLLGRRLRDRAQFPEFRDRHDLRLCTRLHGGDPGRSICWCSSPGSAMPQAGGSRLRASCS